MLLHRFALIAATALLMLVQAGCSPSIPEGRFGCTVADDCPTGWSCGMDGLCYSTPDAAYQRYAQTLVQEGCEGFSRVHNAMTAAQRFKAVQSVKGYEQDFLVLAAQ